MAFSVTSKYIRFRWTGPTTTLNATNAPWLSNAILLVGHSVPNGSGVNGRLQYKGSFGGATPGGALSQLVQNGDYEMNSGAFNGWTLPNATLLSVLSEGTVAPPAPTIASFTPTSGATGTTVTLTGTNFTGAYAVVFNNVVAAAFTVNSATSITATVPAIATSGSVKVFTSGGVATGSTFTVQAAATVPAAVSQPILTPGNTLAGVQWAAPADGGAAITQYKVEYKAGTDLGWTIFGTTAGLSLSVTGLVNGTAYDFRVSAMNSIGYGPPSLVATTTPVAQILPPTITGFSPSSAEPGITVSVTGTNLSTATVKLNGGAPIAPVSASSSQLLFVVPAGSTTGALSVTNSAGTATGGTFTVNAATGTGTAYSFAPADFSDSGAPITADGYVYLSPLSNVKFETDATTMTILLYSTLYPNFDYLSGVAVFIGDTLHAEVFPTQAGAGHYIAVPTMPSGLKTITLVNSAQAYTGGSDKGTWVQGIKTTGTFNKIAPTAPANKYLVLVDSIGVGDHATEPAVNAYTMIARKKLAPGARLSLHGAGSRALSDYYTSTMSTQERETFRNKLLYQLNGTSTNSLVIEIGTNDVGVRNLNAAQAWANLQTLLLDFRGTRPEIQLWVQTPFTRTDSFESTLETVRQSIRNFADANTWLKLIEGQQLVTTADYHDTVHMNTAGHQTAGTKFYNKLLGIIDGGAPGDFTGIVAPGYALPGDPRILQFVEDDNAAVAFTNNPNTDTGSSYHGGSARFKNDVFSGTFQYYGGDIRWFSYNTGSFGIGEVYVDGVYKADVGDVPGQTAGLTPSPRISIPEGLHTVEVRRKSGNFLWDAVELMSK
ncbi:IPT/TIG domain-containing protein [Hymenobacter perfusus]|uniref:Fibronectin type-III domain-containing protein n=1 Tax=Hymenobacter perfusus TaxID=1236770 RepID=A0A3R9NFQ6_9BACT|nr:IPT/TIG domain-containing protein [Hymenobacter perfusus]RSK46105.1 hypothetical protein EI293_02745 [Hymenobacter perfusus]